MTAFTDTEITDDLRLDLDDVKERLKIDFTDHDTMLLQIMRSVDQNAMDITGKPTILTMWQYTTEPTELVTAYNIPYVQQCKIYDGQNEITSGFTKSITANTVTISFDSAATMPATITLKGSRQYINADLDMTLHMMVAFYFHRIDPTFGTAGLNMDILTKRLHWHRELVSE